MTAKTPYFGITIPTDLDEITAISGIVAQGFTDLEKLLTVPSNLAASVPSTSYPLGMSLMTLTGSGAGDGGWPESTSSLVLTLRRTNGEQAAQYWIATSAPRMWMRVAVGTGWSAWSTIAGRGIPTAQASGDITLTGGAGVRSAVVMFPGGRFSAAPQVFVSNTTTRPDIQTGAGSSGVSASQFTVYVNRTDTASASISWRAQLGGDS